MDVSSLMTLVFSGTRSLSSAWVAFHRTKVEQLCQKIIDSGLDVSQIANEKTTQAYFFTIVDKYVREATDKKLEYWKNAMLHLMFDYRKFDFKDNFVSILESLTAFDLTVLGQFYRMNENTDDKFLVDLFAFFADRQVEDYMVLHTIDRLVSQGLITQVTSVGATPTFRSDEIDVSSAETYYTNTMGNKFIDFILQIPNIYSTSHTE
ncbi:hypothetical protein [Alicyclobacillus sp. ALC3]|uniref:hypothetical protein n=1 Tax=Alicyclobacillus sp. ALC3 TaxID=2796143 RepID=UPI0023789967|nr:hypothetical protein [Alicyclobacillus sp. ALC3]WDL97898.1 hypothetical protein JC200_04050 [Alicyclobacillus sp. ALC3]